MASNEDAETIGRLVALVDKLVREKDETKRLIAEFAKGEVGQDKSERIINELAVQYQFELGSTVRGLAEYDKAAAQRLAERLRTRLDEVLADLAKRDAAPVQPARRATGAETFKDRDDGVLRREYVILKLLANRNVDVRSATIFEAVQLIDVEVLDESITAHLGRLVKAGIIAREKKGRYRGNLQSSGYLDALKVELESRQLPLPVVAIEVG